MTPHLLRERARVVRGLRRFFDREGFIEIEPPALVPSPGMEPHLVPFEVPEAGARRFLHTSPEYALKRLLGRGFERIFSLGPCFRDEPPSRTHSPEFTMCEWYSVGDGLHALMNQTEALVRAAADAVGRELPAFERVSVREAFQRHAGVDPWAHPTADALRDAAKTAGVAVPTDSDAWDDVFFQVFLNAVEPHLGQAQPTFLFGYPASQAALARLDPDDPTVALRFELYAGGHELANAFDELTDPEEQRARFEAEQAERAQADVVVPPIDEALLEALDRIPPTAGIALGVDRLVMWLTGAEHIDAVRAQGWSGERDGLVWLDACGSTNDEAMKRVADPMVWGVGADVQTQGRGRRGRAWHSPAGHGLYLTWLARPRAMPVGALPLLAAVAAAEVCTRLGVTPRLKWPNDLLLGEGKLGGILCEARTQGDRTVVAVGLGLNLRTPEGGFPADVPGEALDAHVEPPAARDLALSLLAAFERWLMLSEREGTARVIQAWQGLGPERGARMRQGDVEGAYAGLNDDGALRLLTDKGERIIQFGEVEMLG